MQAGIALLLGTNLERLYWEKLKEHKLIQRLDTKLEKLYWAKLKSTNKISSFTQVYKGFTGKNLRGQ